MGLPPALARLPPAERARLRPAPDDRSTTAARPMPATTTDRLPRFDDRWIFERKLDCVRAVAVRGTGGTRPLSRTGRVMDSTYPEVVDALDVQESGDFVVDGEIVALRDGRTDFSLLQHDLNTTGLSLRTRKALLRGALAFHGPLRCTMSTSGPGTHAAAPRFLGLRDDKEPYEVVREPAPRRPGRRTRRRPARPAGRRTGPPGPLRRAPRRQQHRVRPGFAGLRHLPRAARRP